MFLLAAKNLLRCPGRSLLAMGGLAGATACLLTLLAFGAGYQKALHTEMEQIGLHLMLVPIGCPYDAAARVLSGRTLENSLPAAVLEQVQMDPRVALAAPLLIAAVPRPEEKRVDLWVGLEASARALKPWWQVRSGVLDFPHPDSVILGAEAAEIEMREPGDKFFSPGIGRKFEVAGVLQPSGTNDDTLFFVPLATAQEMFAQPGRLTAIAVQLHDPHQLGAVAGTFQALPGVQAVTSTELTGTLLNLAGSVRTLLQAVSWAALAISLFLVLNTMLAAVLDRVDELAVMRALGASRAQVSLLITAEALLLTAAGAGAGLLLAWTGGASLESVARSFVPMAPRASMITFPPGMLVETLGLVVAAGLGAGLYPAWRASRTLPAEALRSA